MAVSHVVISVLLVLLETFFAVGLILMSSKKSKLCTVESDTFSCFSKHKARISIDTPSPVEEIQGHHSLYYYYLFLSAFPNNKIFHL